MALTEEQKRRIREKAEAEIAARKQQQEENDYYNQLLEVQGVKRANSSPQVVQVQHAVSVNMGLILKVLCALFAIMIGISVFFPYVSISILGSSSGITIAENMDWIFVVAVAVVGLIFVLEDSYVMAAIMGALGAALCFLERSAVTVEEWAANLLKNDIGYYFWLIASILLCVLAIIAKVEYTRTYGKLGRKERKRIIVTVIVIVLAIAAVYGYFIRAGWQTINNLVSSSNDTLSNFAQGTSTQPSTSTQSNKSTTESGTFVDPFATGQSTSGSKMSSTNSQKSSQDWLSVYDQKGIKYYYVPQNDLYDHGHKYYDNKTVVTAIQVKAIEDGMIKASTENNNTIFYSITVTLADDSELNGVSKGKNIIVIGDVEPFDGYGTGGLAKVVDLVNAHVITSGITASDVNARADTTLGGSSKASTADVTKVEKTNVATTTANSANSNRIATKNDGTKLRLGDDGRDDSGAVVNLRYVKRSSSLPTALGDDDSIAAGHEVILAYFEYYNDTGDDVKVYPEHITCYADGVQVSDVETYIKVESDYVKQVYWATLLPETKVRTVQDFEVPVGWSELKFFCADTCIYTVSKSDVKTSSYDLYSTFPMPRKEFTSIGSKVLSDKYDLYYQGAKRYTEHTFLGDNYYVICKFQIKNTSNSSMSLSLTGYKMTAYMDGYYVDDPSFTLGDNIDGYTNIFDIDKLAPGMTANVYVAFEVTYFPQNVLMVYDDGYIVSGNQCNVYSIVER